MKAKVYTTKEEEEIVGFEGEVEHPSPIIELYKDGEWIGNMGMWVDTTNNTIHIYFPSIEPRVKEE